MPKLSIIIPVYNSREYLRRCLDSVLAQDFKDWELIIVDDGSKDGSREIIKEYAKKDTRIKAIFHSENRGAGATRNSGLREVTGEFVAFVDSDDWLEKEMYSSLLAKQAESGADLVECNVMRHEEGREPRPEFKDMPGELDLKNNSDNYLLAMYKRQLSFFTFNKIYRLAIIKNKKISFIASNHFEDLLFSLAISFSLKSFSSINYPYYNYYCHVGSLSHKKINNPGEKVSESLNLYLLEQAKITKNPSSALSLTIITILIKSILTHSFIQSENPIKRGYNSLYQITKIKFIKDGSKKLLFYRPISLKDRLLIWLLFFRAYRLYSLLFYLYAHYNQGSFQNLYVKSTNKII